MRRKTVLAFYAILLGVAGCDIYACKYETRFVSVQGNGTSPEVGNVIIRPH